MSIKCSWPTHTGAVCITKVMRRRISLLRPATRKPWSHKETARCCCSLIISTKHALLFIISTLGINISKDSLVYRNIRGVVGYWMVHFIANLLLNVLLQEFFLKISPIFDERATKTCTNRQLTLVKNFCDFKCLLQSRSHKIRIDKTAEL